MSNINQNRYLSIFLLQTWTLYLSDFTSSILTFRNSKWKRSDKPDIVLIYQREDKGSLHLMQTIIFHRQWLWKISFLKKIMSSIWIHSIWIHWAFFLIVNGLWLVASSSCCHDFSATIYYKLEFWARNIEAFFSLNCFLFELCIYLCMGLCVCSVCFFVFWGPVKCVIYAITYE